MPHCLNLSNMRSSNISRGRSSMSIRDGKYSNAIVSLFRPRIHWERSAVQDEKPHNRRFANVLLVFERKFYSTNRRTMMFKGSTNGRSIAYLVIPDFHQTIITTGDQVGFITAGIVIHTVHTFLVAFESKVWLGRSQLPDLRRVWSEEEKSFRSWGVPWQYGPERPKRTYCYPWDWSLFALHNEYVLRMFASMPISHPSPTS